MQSAPPVIEARALSKSYRIWASERARLRSPLLRLCALLAPTQGLRSTLLRRERSLWRDFAAISNLDLSIRRGECVGIVGRNGSGKSTLLQLICGILQPTRGSVHVAGRVAALLELGSGFNPEFTGRENVFLNASILGLSRDEVEARFEEIAAFADIGDFIEQPVRTYSSGMMLRLAFAVQVLVDPDLLIVDEALSVGDEPFQRKCFARMETLREKGATVLFVSHDMTPVLNLCDRAILLHKGRLVLDDSPKRVASVYQRFNHAPADRAEALLAELCAEKKVAAPVPASAPADGLESPHPEHFDPSLSPESTQVYDSLGAKISDLRLVDEEGSRVNHLQRRGFYTYRYRVDFSREVKGVNFAMLIKSLMGVELGGARTLPAYKPLESVPAGSRYEVSFRFQCLLTQGCYAMNAGVEAEIDGKSGYATRVIDALLFKVLPEQNTLPTVTVDFLVEPSFRKVK
jgi:lipopolysaccharide transport system ATP-binding protein